MIGSRIKPLWWPVLALSAIALFWNASSCSEAEADLWQQAIESYAQQDYGAAAVRLQRILKGEPSPHESAAWLLLGRCYLHLGRLKDAEEAARALICRFPHGRYAPYANYLRAQIEFQKEDFFDAALQLLEAAQATADDELNLLARGKLDRIFEIYLHEEQRSRLLPWVKSPVIRAELSAVQEGIKLPMKVGVILQLTGARGDEGQDILAGIEAACAEARKRSRLEVEIVARDSHGDMIEAIRAAQTLISEEDAVALIGDLEGSCSADVAAVANEDGIPLIIPASQDVGLTSIGENIFQLAADLQMEGAAAADFTVSDLGAQHVAILAPASEEGAQRVKGFQQRLEHLGSEVAGVQWYYRETTDFRRPLEMLSQVRLPAAQATPQPAETDSSASADSSKEGGSGGTVYSDSVLANMPINYFDALYLPIQGDEMAVLSAQLAAMGYRGALIGSSNCLDLVGKEANRRYVEGMVFPSLFPTAQGWPQDSDFGKSYQSRTGVYPNRWNVLGWDAFNFLAQALKDSGKLSPRKIVRRLRDMRRFPGVHGALSFGEGSRVNGSVYLLRFENGQLVQVKSAP